MLDTVITQSETYHSNIARTLGKQMKQTESRKRPSSAARSEGCQADQRAALPLHKEMDTFVPDDRWPRPALTLCAGPVDAEWINSFDEIPAPVSDRLQNRLAVSESVGVRQTPNRQTPNRLQSDRLHTF